MDYTEKIAVYRSVKVRTEGGKHRVFVQNRVVEFSKIWEAIVYAYGCANAHF